MTETEQQYQACIKDVERKLREEISTDGGKSLSNGLLSGGLKWITGGKPVSEDIWCVIQFDGDYEFAYWVAGCNAWDCPDIGFIDDSHVDGWTPLPPLL